jgi:3-oxoacyl-[acyl-carrier protein] reductase
MHMAQGPRGERVLVVGGSSGVGAAVVARFAAAGDAVFATHHASPPPASTAGVQWAPLDVASASSRAGLLDLLAAWGTPIDVVVVVAGTLPGKSLVDYAPEEIERCMHVNATGPFHLLRDLMPRLSDGSRVLMFASVSGERGSYDPVYAAAKGAVIAFVKSMATWAAPRTRFVAIAPGLVEDSGMFEAMAPERRDVHRRATPVGLAGIDALAAAAHDLTRPHWAHANGSCVRFNGGAYV